MKRLGERGPWILFEGLDGSGKEAAMLGVHTWLYGKNKKYNVYCTRQPTYRKHGKEARALLTQDTDPKANADKCLEYFVQDRADHIQNEILPLLNSTPGHVVLQDRGHLSTLAYQGAQGIGLQRIVSLHDDITMPDLILVLKLPVEQALARRTTAGYKLEKFEHDAQFLQRVCDLYNNATIYWPEQRIKYIDSSNILTEKNANIERVVSACKDEIEKAKILPY